MPALFNPALDTPVYPDSTIMCATYSNGIDAGAVFSRDPVTGQPGIYRYVLWRMWGEQLPLVMIGLNPSTATHLMVDPTVRRCIRFARDLGYGGLIMLNLHAFRATIPQQLKWQFDPTGLLNDVYLRWYTAEGRAGIVIAGWGVHGAQWGRGEYVRRMLIQRGTRLHCLAVTDAGYPRHPLYIRADAQPTPY
jgi:hypothetical protein